LEPTSSAPLRVKIMTKPRVMFLCTGNSARSQIAEGFLRHVAGDRFDVVSAGTDPAGLNPLSVEVMKEIGIDLSGHRSKAVTDYLGQHFTYLITVCDGAREKCPIFPGAVRRLHWPLADPAAVAGDVERRRAAFRRTRDEIAERVRAFVADPSRDRQEPGGGT
jgi:arsenate reductase